MKNVELSKKDYVIGYYNKGKDCIEDATFLFESNRIQCYEILLLNGLELLFKSFILMKEFSATNEDLKKFGHDYLKAYKHCLKLDDAKIISSEEFKEQLNFLHDFYEPDPIKSRYAERHGLRYFPKDIFRSTEKNIINPILPLVKEFYKSFDEK